MGYDLFQLQVGLHDDRRIPRACGRSARGRGALMI